MLRYKTCIFKNEKKINDFSFKLGKYRNKEKYKTLKEIQTIIKLNKIQNIKYATKQQKIKLDAKVIKNIIRKNTKSQQNKKEQKDNKKQKMQEKYLLTSSVFY